MKNFIKLEDVNLKYTLFSENKKSLKYNMLTVGGRLSKENKNISVHALKNIFLDVKEGSRIGLLGVNGSGKTTLLKVLSQIYQPTTGTIKCSGKINSMISLNEGFDNNLTGKELTDYKYLLQFNEIPEQKIIDKIHEISELGDWFNLPVYSYSSGMLMRLLFAIQMSFDADILIFDEWLSVGDEQFQTKCRDIILERLDRSKIFILASHNAYLVNTICNVRIYIDKGSIVSIERA